MGCQRPRLPRGSPFRCLPVKRTHTLQGTFVQALRDLLKDEQQTRLAINDNSIRLGAFSLSTQLLKLMAFDKHCFLHACKAEDGTINIPWLDVVDEAAGGNGRQCLNASLLLVQYHGLLPARWIGFRGKCAANKSYIGAAMGALRGVHWQGKAVQFLEALCAKTGARVGLATKQLAAGEQLSADQFFMALDAGAREVQVCFEAWLKVRRRSSSCDAVYVQVICLAAVRACT